MSSTIDQIISLGRELNAHHHRIVCLAAVYDTGLEWFHRGYPSPAAAIARALDIHTATAREWIRVGHALDDLPTIADAFADNELSYAKVRILTRWATPDNEHELLMLAHDRTADRLTTAIANHLAGEETPDERDRRHHDGRSVTVHTDGDGMIVIRAVLPPNIGKAVAETLNTIIQQVAATPMEASADASPPPPVSAATSGGQDASADASPPPPVSAATSGGQDASADASPLLPVSVATSGGQDAPADASPLLPVSVATSGGQDASADASPLLPVSVATSGGRDASEDVSGTVAVADGRSMGEQLRALKSQWQPADAGDFFVPTLAQQRADAFVLLFLGRDVELVTEVVIHVRGDGTTFDDGTPITDNAVCQRLDQSFIRVMVHDSQRRPINASNRRRHPTIRQRRVVLEAHRHECVDCQSTELLELDHQPPYQQTGRTVTTELEPRCAPCHRARHRT